MMTAQNSELQFLVSAMGKEDIRAHVEKMNLSAESIVIHQCGCNAHENFQCNGQNVRCYHFAERGVGLSRNNALLRADREFAIFADEDIVYEDGAASKILNAFAEHPEADVLLFNVKVTQERRTYWTEQFHRVRWYNSGRYPAYSIAIRTEKMHANNLTYSLLFGGGAKYSNGEDSLFIRDCLKAGLKIYAVPVCIGEEIPRPSTWFFGYNEKFFYDRGVLYHYLYGKMARLWGLRFLLKIKPVLEAQNGAAGDTAAEGAAEPNARKDGVARLDWKQACTCLYRGITDARKGR